MQRIACSRRCYAKCKTITYILAWWLVRAKTLWASGRPKRGSSGSKREKLIQKLFISSCHKSVTIHLKAHMPRGPLAVLALVAELDEATLSGRRWALSCSSDLFCWYLRTCLKSLHFTCCWLPSFSFWRWLRHVQTWRWVTCFRAGVICDLRRSNFNWCRLQTCENPWPGATFEASSSETFCLRIWRFMVQDVGEHGWTDREKNTSYKSG